MPGSRLVRRVRHLGFLLAAIGLLVAVCAGPPSRAGMPETPHGRVSADSHISMPAPAPKLDPNALRGCAPAAPRPYPSTIFAATPQGAAGRAPAEVALTFDDGPAYTTTPRFLAYLERTRTPATFFLIGYQAEALPDLVRREWRDGFTIGVHTWSHPAMTRLTLAQMRWQLSSTLQALHAIVGDGACIWLWRPPYGAVNPTVRDVAASLGLTTVNWDADGRDWARPGADAIASTILRRVHPGSIVLMHDGPALRDQTLAALPLILGGLRARGLTPVTLPHLLADYGYPGVRVGTAGTSAVG